MNVRDKIVLLIVILIVGFVATFGFRGDSSVSLLEGDVASLEVPSGWSVVSDDYFMPQFPGFGIVSESGSEFYVYPTGSPGFGPDPDTKETHAEDIISGFGASKSTFYTPDDFPVITYIRVRGVADHPYFTILMEPRSLEDLEVMESILDSVRIKKWKTIYIPGSSLILSFPSEFSVGTSDSSNKKGSMSFISPDGGSFFVSYNKTLYTYDTIEWANNNKWPQPGGWTDDYDVVTIAGLDALIDRDTHSIIIKHGLYLYNIDNGIGREDRSLLDFDLFDEIVQSIRLDDTLLNTISDTKNRFSVEVPDGMIAGASNDSVCLTDSGKPDGLPSDICVHALDIDEDFDHLSDEDVLIKLSQRDFPESAIKSREFKDNGLYVEVDDFIRCYFYVYDANHNLAFSFVSVEDCATNYSKFSQIIPSIQITQ